MIQSDKGIVAMSGNLPTILADLSMIVDCLKAKDKNLKEILQTMIEEIWDNEEGKLGQKTKQAIERYNNLIDEEADKKIDKELDKIAEEMAEKIIDSLLGNKKEETKDENN